MWDTPSRLNFASIIYAVLGVLAGVWLFAFSGCGRSPEGSAGGPASAPDDQPFIAFVGAGERDPLWPILKSAAAGYASQLPNMPVRYFAPAISSPTEQLELLKTLPGKALRGLCIQISDPQTLTPILERFHHEGVVIVSMVQPAPPELRVGHVGFDEQAVGQALAEATAQTLGGAGDVMLLHAGETHPVYGPRLSAFRRQLGYYPRISLFAEIDCQGNSRQARRIIRERSARYPRLSAWIALDDWPMRDLPAGEKVFPPGCKYVTFGGLPEQWPLMEKGTIAALLAANYRELGSKALLFCAIAMNRASRFETVYNAPLRTVWPTNLEAYKSDWAFWSTGDYVRTEPPSSY